MSDLPQPMTSEDVKKFEAEQLVRKNDMSELDKEIKHEAMCLLNAIIEDGTGDQRLELIEDILREYYDKGKSDGT